jgi:hypothetical protein
MLRCAQSNIGGEELTSVDSNFNVYAFVVTTRGLEEMTVYGGIGWDVRLRNVMLGLSSNGDVSIRKTASVRKENRTEPIVIDRLGSAQIELHTLKNITRNSTIMGYRKT